MTMSPIMSGTNLTASITSDVSRLSVNTIMPMEPPYISNEAIRPHHLHHDANMSSDCRRSQSSRSRDSNPASSSVDTDTNESPFDNSMLLQRNGSWSSTTPTSPETEVSVGHLSNYKNDVVQPSDASLPQSDAVAVLPIINSAGPPILNRNKPLPVPDEHLAAIEDSIKTSLEVPSFNIEPGSDDIVPAADASSAWPSASPSLPASDEGVSSRRGLRSMMGKSSQLFRRSTDSRGAIASRSPQTPSRRKSNGLSAKEPFSWFYRSLPPSPNPSVLDLPPDRDEELEHPPSSSEVVSQRPLNKSHSQDKAQCALISEESRKNATPIPVRPRLVRNRSRSLDTLNGAAESEKEKDNPTIKPALSPQHDSIALGTTSILEVPLANFDQLDQTLTHAPVESLSFPVAEKVKKASVAIAAPSSRQSRLQKAVASPSLSPCRLNRGDITSDGQISRSGSSCWDDDFKSALSSAFSSCRTIHDEAIAAMEAPGEGVPLESSRLSPLSQPLLKTDQSQGLSRGSSSYSPRFDIANENVRLDIERSAVSYKDEAEAIAGTAWTQEIDVATLNSVENGSKGEADSSLRATRVNQIRHRDSEAAHEPLATDQFKAATVLSPREGSQRSLRQVKDERSDDRKPLNLATLSIVDDTEFLQALEQVRKTNQERIRKKEEMAIRLTEMARMGMASSNKRAGRGREKKANHGDVNGEGIGRAVKRVPMQRRSSSADARYYSTEASHEAPSALRSNLRDYKNRRTDLSALEMGVGKASGKLQDGAFINDDDWKREVKALFVIRELVLTERSYARHLEALLQIVRSHYTPARRLSVSSSMCKQSGQFPPHFLLMRNLLPQLIALSRNLANRIDEDPTAAGVGAAFRAVQSQMEATFIAWNSSVKEIMCALSAIEKPKSKSPHRIGLVTLAPLENSISTRTKQDNGFISVPASPKISSSHMKRLSAGGLDEITRHSRSHSGTRAPSPLESDQKDDDSITRMISTKHKRRSTFSGLGPPFSLPPKSPSGIGRKALEVVVSSTRPIFTTPITAPTKSATFTSPSSSSTSASTSPIWSSKRPTASSHTSATSSSGHLCVDQDLTDTPGAITPNMETTSKASKKLSALDIAIMPTQRLPRYLLLLRDLNMNTPPQSLSHIRLQRSLDMLMNIARRCDEASQ